MTLTLLADRAADRALGAPGVRRPDRSGTADLPGRLTREWQQLCADPAARAVVAGWDDPELAGAQGPAGLEARVQHPGTGLRERDAVLCALLRRAQAGDALAGRVVLQVMLPKAVRIGAGLAGWVDGDREEAFAMVFAALWRTIMTYPLARRPRRVTGNLAMETLQLVRGRQAQREQRTETPYGDLIGGEERRPGVRPGQPTAELRAVGPAADGDVPVDLELLGLLAWAVGRGVLTADQARLLARVYGLDPGVDGPAVAAELDLSWPALRQRCSRLTATLRRAALAEGLTGMAAPLAATA